MADEFGKQKHRSLNQVDLSKKGSIDEHIVDIVQHINSFTDYFTTSSCSGRICVFSEDTDQKKKSGRWLFVSHDLVKVETVCRALEDAQAMLRVALESGYKNSGIVVGKKGRFILAVRSTQSLEVPIIHNGKLMVSNETLCLLRPAQGACTGFEVNDDDVHKERFSFLESGLPHRKPD
ncbi:hypothetical protein QZH41_009547 [Actinostola sp. cb2023]|nr:hypothetical protein QZH41_009547 [Actinostola sp. cb2023]